jgi:hypothetical protein
MYLQLPEIKRQPELLSKRGCTSYGKWQKAKDGGEQRRWHATKRCAPYDVDMWSLLFAAMLWKKEVTLGGLAEWINSEGKKFLKKELWDVSSRYHIMSIKEIHASDIHFSIYPLKNFSANFKSLKMKLDGLRMQVEFNNQVLYEHNKLYPQAPNNEWAYPHWNGHPAKEHLEDTICNGIVDKMLPSKPHTKSSHKTFSVSRYMPRSRNRGSKPFRLQSKTKLQWNNICKKQQSWERVENSIV